MMMPPVQMTVQAGLMPIGSFRMLWLLPKAVMKFE